MKRLYNRLTVTFLVSAILTAVIFAVSLYARGIRENGRYLDQLLSGIQNNLDRAAEEYEQKLEYLKEDYLSRARAVGYIAVNDSRLSDGTGLAILKELMEVKEISLIDSSGKIYLSTDKNLQGQKEDEAVMEELSRKADGEQEAVRMDTADFHNGPEYLYVVVGSGSEHPSAVRIDGDLSREELTGGIELVGGILKQATTEYETGIFAVSKKNGSIFGITENNSQQIRIRDAEEGPELLDYFAGLPKEEPVLLDINGSVHNAVIKDMDDMYLTAFSGLDQITGNIILTFWLGIAVIGVISILTVLMVRYHLKKYLFIRFEKIRNGIYGVIQGKSNFQENVSEIPELNALSEMILRLEKEYIEKSQGIHRIENKLSEARTEAEYDSLTGLYNRHGFERRAQVFLNEKSPSGVLILLDLDNFKLINDGEGHPEGDRVLRKFAGCLSGFFRKGDVIGRIGGDEFAVLIRDPVPRKILEEKFTFFLHDVRRQLNKWYQKYRVSVSIGAVPAGGKLIDYRKLYRCADTALYISKYLGKDSFYINEKMIDCMRRECIGCRTDCPRSSILREEQEKGQ